jgi:hypothetical protein
MAEALTETARAAVLAQHEKVQKAKPVIGFGTNGAHTSARNELARLRRDLIELERINKLHEHDDDRTLARAALKINEERMVVYEAKPEVEKSRQMLRWLNDIQTTIEAVAPAEVVAAMASGRIGEAWAASAPYIRALPQELDAKGAPVSDILSVIADSLTARPGKQPMR